MNSSAAYARFRDCLLTECDICRHLSDQETSFTKWGWEEQSRRMPAEAGLLKRAAPPDAGGGREETVLRCPECGTCYLYASSSEYLANGSEDEATLVRVAPTRVRACLEDVEYLRLVATAGRGLNHPAAVNRRHAARCLTARHLEQGEAGPVREFLTSPDIERVRGALFCLRSFLQRGERRPETEALRDALMQLVGHADGEISLVAPYLIRLMAAGPAPAP